MAPPFSVVKTFSKRKKYVFQTSEILLLGDQLITNGATIFRGENVIKTKKIRFHNVEDSTAWRSINFKFCHLFSWGKRLQMENALKRRIFYCRRHFSFLKRLHDALTAVGGSPHMARRSRWAGRATRLHQGNDAVPKANTFVIRFCSKIPRTFSKHKRKKSSLTNSAPIGLSIYSFEPPRNRREKANESLLAVSTFEPSRNKKGREDSLKGNVALTPIGFPVHYVEPPRNRREKSERDQYGYVATGGAAPKWRPTARRSMWSVARHSPQGGRCTTRRCDTSQQAARHYTAGGRRSTRCGGVATFYSGGLSRGGGRCD